MDTRRLIRLLLLLGLIAVPAAAQIVTSPPNILNNPIITGSATFSALTPNAFLYSGAGGVLSSTAAPTNGQLLIGSTGAAPVLATLTGTANRVSVTNAAGSITLSAPQDLHTGASPTFAGMTLSGLTASRIPFAGTGGLLSDDSNLVWDNTNKRMQFGGSALAAPIGILTPSSSGVQWALIHGNSGALNNGGSGVRIDGGGMGGWSGWAGVANAAGSALNLYANSALQVRIRTGSVGLGAFQSQIGGALDEGLLTERLVLSNANYVGSVNAGGTATLKIIGLDASDDSYAPNSIKLGDPGAKPTCAVARRGLLWHDYGGAGVKDTVEVCAKDAADAYAWRVIY